jgi:lipoyl synthase
MSKTQLFDVTPRVKKPSKLPVHEDKEARGRFPSWLHRPLPKKSDFAYTTSVLKNSALPTVCEEAKCPNRFECYSKKTATFLILGKECTRACGFCDIDTSSAPPPPEKDEPRRLVESVKSLGLKHVVITMVARDDLSDGGSAHLAEILSLLKTTCPNTSAEVLTSDFEGKRSSIDVVLAEKPAIFNHNIETIQRLTPTVRHKATYNRSLEVLSYVNDSKTTQWIKSGMMLGLGETPDEVQAAMRDLKSVGCNIITLGQYLQPSRKKLRVKAFIPPEQFNAYADYGKSIGIDHVYAGPFVRSSYNADSVYEALTKRDKT